MSKVEKAEQRAFEAYPVLFCYDDFQMVEEDVNKQLREVITKQKKTQILNTLMHL